jgi:polyphenol oxidase
MFREINKNGVIYMTSPNISVRHGFTTRFGGVSEGIFSSLNLGLSCGDETDRALENYRILGAAMGIDTSKAAYSKQVHRDDIRVCTDEDRRAPLNPVPYEADGLITNIPNLPLLIFTADCTPILFHDSTAGIVGAAHAGWRGTVLDIAGKTVRKMTEVYGCRPENIHAAIGPCISKCCFETGAEVYEALKGVLGAEADEFAKRKPDGKYMTDLKGANCRLLERAGVENIEVSDECTMCSSDKYWSHRATGGKRGVQCSLIVLD